MPSSASSTLLAVTTALPAASAVSSRDRAGSMPPITSTTMSTSSRPARATASVVISPGSTATARARAGRRTATPATSSGAPTRASRSAAWSPSSRYTSEPTMPQPSSATFKGFPWSFNSLPPSRALRLVVPEARKSAEREAGPRDRDAAPRSVAAFGPAPVALQLGLSESASSLIQAEQVFGGFPAEQDAGDAVTDRHDRRPRHVVVVARHRATVRAGGRHRDQVPRREVGRQVGVPDHDVPALAMPADQPGEHRRRDRLPGGK